MAYVYLAAYVGASNTPNDLPYWEYRQAVGATSQQTDPVPPPPTGLNVKVVVRIVSDVNCHMARGTSPTASATSGEFMPAFSVEYMDCKPGWRVAVLEEQG